MRQAVIVSYARTGLAKAGRGGFNNTSNMTILGHAIEHAVKRSGVDPAEVEDVIAGCVAASGNVARAAALLAGLPVTTSGMTMHRACSSGLNAIAAAAHHIVEDGHFLTANHRNAPDLVRIEPADVNMCGLTAGETQGHEDRVRNTRLKIGETLRRHRNRLLF